MINKLLINLEQAKHSLTILSIKIKNEYQYKPTHMMNDINILNKMIERYRDEKWYINPLLKGKENGSN